MLTDNLSFKHYILLAAVLALIYAWLMVDQIFISKVLFRFIALIVVAVGLLTGFFFIVKPKEPIKLAGFLSLYIGTFAVVVSVIQHVIIHFDISWKAPMIWAIAFLSPFLPAWIYRKLKS
jgi:hypothetical protein